MAEVPLVATRFQYRRLGMCRILMDELEKVTCWMFLRVSFLLCSFLESHFLNFSLLPPNSLFCQMLMELGVERLVLPAVPSVLNTWTTSFGFSKMTPSERLKFLDYTFLDFQGTIMCQKLLNKNAPAEARPLKSIFYDQIFFFFFFSRTKWNP